MSGVVICQSVADRGSQATDKGITASFKDLNLTLACGPCREDDKVLMEGNEEKDARVPLLIWGALPARTLPSSSGPYLIEVGDDLVQQTQTLQPLLVDIALRVEDFEVRHGREHDTNAVIGLMVPVLNGGGGGCPYASRPGGGAMQAQGLGPSAQPTKLSGEGSVTQVSLGLSYA